MPPEPLPWDRKDFFKEKKLERPDSLGPVARWRDSHHGSRDLVQWGPDEFRRPLGHGKHGGHQSLSSLESPHGCIETRPGDSMLDDDSCRPSVSLVDGKYDRNNRDKKGSFSPHAWKTGNASVNSLEKHHDLSAHRLVDTQTSQSQSQFGTEKLNPSEINAVDDLASAHKLDKAQSLGTMVWKPLKWNRSSSLSSRGSGFGHSSSSKSNRADSDEMKPDSHLGKRSPLQSPSGDGTAGVTSASPSEDTCSKKKPRLGWGDGLAKYEKKKVEGPYETHSKDGLVGYAGSKSAQSPFMSMSDRSPRVPVLTECASPATPSSVACSSSPGLEDKSYIKAANTDHEASNISGSPGHGFQNCSDGLSADLDHLDLNLINNFGSMLIDVLQPEDGSSRESNFLKSTAMNKLLLFKIDLLKAIEETEYEIDLFENELKSLDSDSKGTLVSPTTSNSVQMEGESKKCAQLDDASKVFSKPSPLKLDSSGDMLGEGTLLCNKNLDEIQPEVKVEDIDSPGTATSNFFESPASLGNVVSSFNTVKHDGCCTDYQTARPTASEEQCSFPSTDEKKSTDISGNGDVISLKENTEFQLSDDVSQHTDAEHKLHDSIWLPNKDAAREAFEEFKMMLPIHEPQTDIWEANRLLCQQDNSAIEREIAKRKFSLRFKERTLILKFKALQHLWKEDMRLLSIRKCRPKSQKRSELSLRSCHAGNQKHRSSIRARFTSPACNLTLVPASEIVDFNSRLLSDSQIKPYRSSLKMPAFILDEKDRMLSGFVKSNGLVEDPCALEKERAMTNIWFPAEKEIFMEMLATFGKDFKKISSFLEHKTTADCVDFYYRNHKSESFEKIREKMELRKQGRTLPTNTYMVTSGKKWNREMNAASLHMLATHANDHLKNQQASSGRILERGLCDYKTSRVFDGVLKRSSSADILRNEREAVAADVLAGISGALSSEALSSCITSSFDLGEGYKDLKCQKANSLIYRRPLTPEVMQNINDEETCSDESYGEVDSIDWTDEEKSIFIQALGSYGKDFAKISRRVRTKSRDQCMIFFSKARKCLGLDVIRPAPGNEETPVTDASGGRSDTEDACVVEMESAICSTQSCSKMDVDMPPPVIPTNIETSRNTQLPENNGIEELGCGNAETGLDTIDDHNCQSGLKPDSICDSDNNLVEREKEEEPVEIFQSNEAVLADTELASEGSVQLREDVVLTDGAAARTDEANGRAIALTEKSSSAQEPTELGQSVEPEAVIDASCEVLKSKQQIFVPGSNSGTDTRNCKSGSSANSDSSHPSADASSLHSGFSLTTNSQHQIPLELLPSIPKSRTILWQQNNYSMTTNSTTPLISQPPSSILNFEEHGNKQHRKSQSADVFPLGQHPLNHEESLQILKGYPLRVLSKREINKGDAGDTVFYDRATIVQSFSKMNRNSQSSQYHLTQDLYNGNCNVSKSHHPVTDFSREQLSSEPQRTNSRSSSDTEGNSRRTGNFKLFGQILSNPSSLQKTNPCIHENGNKVPSSLKSSMKSCNMKFNQGGTEGSLFPSKPDPTNHSCLEEFPIKSYGVWDGSRIQTGLSSLPDSSVLLDPPGFKDLPSVRRNDRNVGCVSVFPTKDVNGDVGLADFQVYRNFDGSKPPPFTVFSEVNKQNGFETMSGFQQQSRGVVRGGITVGAGSTGVSDPVAAIRMHYATTTAVVTERYGGQASIDKRKRSHGERDHER